MDASFPITLLRDLPVQSGSVDPHGVHVVAVVDGRYARRVPLDSVQDVFVSRDAHVPSSYDSASSGDMAWDRTGLYVHTDAGWGKTMLYCSNWPDLTPTTRFLRVDAVMSLSGTEVGNALSSLGIEDATDSLRGLVRLAGSMLDGAAVPTAATVAAYVAGELQGVRDDVAAVGEMRDDVAGMLQDVGSMESSVRSMRDDVAGAASEVHADMSRAETASSGAYASAQAAREAMEAAEAAADRAEASVEFDEVATRYSRKAVRSGGLYDEFTSVKGSVQNVSDTLDAHTGDRVVHITQAERDRWNAGGGGGGGGLTPAQQTVLDRLVGGAVAGEFSVWSATEPPSSATIHSYIGSSGTAIDLSADSVSIASGTGVSVEGGLDVDGSPVLTRAMVGSFPGDSGSSEVDGLATVSDARAYISRSISESAGTVLANYVPLYGDSRITGSLSMSGESRASTGTFSNGIAVTSATAVSSLAGRIDSDVKIGYGPIGNVKAETLLEVGDPKAAGTLSYNGFTLRIEAGSRSKARGQLKLVNGYETCTVSIGGVTKSVSPVPRDTSVQAVELLAADSEPVSNDGEGTCASCLFGPPPTDVCGYLATPASSPASRSEGIIVHWNGDGGPGTRDGEVFLVPNADVGVAPTLLDVQEAIASDPVFSEVLEASLVDPSADCATAVVSLRAKKAGSLYNNFGISAYAGRYLESRTIPEVALQGGGGSQEATNAIGVLTVVYPEGSAMAGAYLRGESSLMPSGSGGLEITLYKGDSVLATGHVDSPGTSTVSQAGLIIEELDSMLSDAGLSGAISFYKGALTFKSFLERRAATIRGKVETPGADGNNYRVHMRILPGEYSYDGYTYEIKFFAGADGGSSPTPPGPTPEPPAYGTAYGDIGPSVNGTGQYSRGVGISWHGEGSTGVNPVYLLPHIGGGSLPKIDDFGVLHPGEFASQVFMDRLRGEYVSGNTDESYVYRLVSTHKGAVDNGFAAVALDSNTANSLTAQLTGGLETEQEAVCAIGVLQLEPIGTASPSLMSFGDTDTSVVVPAGCEVFIYYNNVAISSRTASEDLTLDGLCALLKSMQEEDLGEERVTPVVVRTSVMESTSRVATAYTLHCKAVTPGADGNSYRIYSSLSITHNIAIRMFAGADAYSPGPGPTPPGPTPEYDPVTPQQVATLVSTIQGYTGTVSSTDSNVVNVEAVQPGSAGNREMFTSGGLLVQTPLGGGSDDRGVGELATAISTMDGFNVSASVYSPSVIRIVANASGSGPNGRALSATGCFGTGGAVMGSLVPGADGIPGTSYNLWINGVRVVPGQGGGGEPFDGHLENNLYIGHEGTAFKIYLNGEEFKGGVDVDDTPEEGGTNPISSGWAYTHSTASGLHWTEQDRRGFVQHTQCLLHMAFLPAGNSDMYARYFILDSGYEKRGFLKSITLKCRASGEAQQQPFYIGVFEQPDGGGDDPAAWNFLGASDGAAQEAIGETRTWNFDNMEIVGGRRLAFCPMSTPDQGWGTAIIIGLRCHGREDWDSSSIVYGKTGGAKSYVPQMTMSYLLMAGEHVADASIHLGSFDRNLLNNLGEGRLGSYDILTTNDLDPSALLARVSALEPPRENWAAFRLDNSYLVETYKKKGLYGGVGAFSVDGSGNLRSKYGGGVAGVMLPRAVKHFEGTMGTAGQNIAVLIATKLGDETGGVGVYIGNNNSNNMFICDASEASITITDTVQGYSKLPSVPSGRLTVDILDMYDSPQSGTGYTKRVVVKVDSTVVLDTYVDGGVGTKTGYVAPRIGFLGSWSTNGSWLLSDCKIAYRGVPPPAALESAEPVDGGSAE